MTVIQEPPDIRLRTGGLILCMILVAIPASAQISSTADVENRISEVEARFDECNKPNNDMFSYTLAMNCSYKARADWERLARQLVRTLLTEAKDPESRASIAAANAAHIGWVTLESEAIRSAVQETEQGLFGQWLSDELETSLWESRVKSLSVVLEFYRDCC